MDELGLHIFHFSMRPELTVDGPENQQFWQDVELQYAQKYSLETDSDYNFKPPLLQLKAYFQAVAQMNRKGQCQFGTSMQSPMLVLLKRHFLRYTTIDKEDITPYIKIIHILSSASTL